MGIEDSIKQQMAETLGAAPPPPPPPPPLLAGKIGSTQGEFKLERLLTQRKHVLFDYPVDPPSGALVEF